MAIRRGPGASSSRRLVVVPPTPGDPWWSLQTSARHVAGTWPTPARAAIIVGWLPRRRAAGHPPLTEPEERPPVTATLDVPVPTLVGESVVVEPDAVRILDRRVFPFERTWVTCRSHEDVASAIEDMVTQSLGPLLAAAGGATPAGRG